MTYDTTDICLATYFCLKGEEMLAVRPDPDGCPHYIFLDSYGCCGGWEAQFDTVRDDIKQELSKLTGEERVSVVDEMSLASKEPIDSISQIPGDLSHPSTVRLVDNSGDVHSSRLEVNYEEDTSIVRTVPVAA